MAAEKPDMEQTTLTVEIKPGESDPEKAVAVQLTLTNPTFDPAQLGPVVAYGREPGIATWRAFLRLLSKLPEAEAGQLGNLALGSVQMLPYLGVPFKVKLRSAVPLGNA
jgi:hypothetical protein